MSQQRVRPLGRLSCHNMVWPRPVSNQTPTTGWAGSKLGRSPWRSIAVTAQAVHKTTLRGNDPVPFRNMLSCGEPAHGGHGRTLHGRWDARPAAHCRAACGRARCLRRSSALAAGQIKCQATPEGAKRSSTPPPTARPAIASAETGGPARSLQVSVVDRAGRGALARGGHGRQDRRRSPGYSWQPPLGAG
jgi:hypothetical protein